MFDFNRNDYYIMSEPNSEKSAQIKIDIEKCRNSTDSNITWKASYEIEAVLNTGYLSMIYISGYFDSHDYKTPIKSRENYFDYITFLPDLYQSYRLEVQENEVFLSDNIFFSETYKRSKYYSAKEPFLRLYNSNNNPDRLVSIDISLSEESEQFERTVYTFLDMFGFLGGIFDFCFFLGYLFVHHFNDKYFKLTMLTKLYQVEQTHMRPDSKLSTEFHNPSIMPKSKNRAFKSHESMSSK